MRAGTRIEQGTGKALGFISPHAVIGEPPEHRDYRWKALSNTERAFYAPLISTSAIVEAFVTVDAGIESSTVIGARTMLMKHCHVGHDAIVGEDCNIAPGVMIGGHVVISRRVKVGMGAMIRPRIKIGEGAIIGMGTVVVKDVPPGETWAGNPARRIENREPKEWTPEQEYDAWMEWYEESRKPREWSPPE